MSEKEKESEECSEGDLVEKVIGPIGPWQLIIVVAVSLTKVSVSWHQLAILFLAPPQNFWCARPPGFENISVDVWKNISSPPGAPACFRYNLTDADLSDSALPAEKIPCTDWEFDTEIFETTIISQWNLVCNREFLAHVAQTIYMFGILIGSFIFGIVADKCGRKYPLLGSVILQFVSGTVTAFCSNFYFFMTMRFLDAVATGGLMVTSFVICMELVGSKWRATVAIIYHIPFALGHLSLPGVAYFLRNWRYFQLAISVPSVLLIAYFWLVPESPRWLLTMGRVEEAEKILKTGARRNRLPDSNIREMIDQRIQTSTKHASFLDLFKHRNLRRKTLCISFSWTVCGVCFFGLAQYVGQIDGNIFTNVAWSAVISVPGQLFCIYVNQKCGRRSTLIASQFITALSCFLIVAVPKHIVWPSVALATTGLISMSVAFPTVYLYSGELFPTVVRNAGVGFASVCARFGSMAAPFISGLGSYGAYLPPIVFGIFPIFGCLLCFLLPETVDTVLPDTIQDGETCSKKRTKSSNCA